MEQMTSICDMVGQIMQKKEEERRIAEDQAAKDRYRKIPISYDDDEDYTIAITPVLLTKEPVDSLIMENEHLDTIPATESNEVIKSSVEELVLIPSESEGIFDSVCDVPLCDNPTPLKAFKDHSEIVVDSNDDDTSSDDVNFEDIEYVEASPPDLKIVSLEEVNDVDQEKEEFDLENILPIQDSPSPFPILVSNSFFEKSDTSLSYSDNSLPEFESFSDHTEETSSGSTTTHANNSLPEYDSFHFEIEPDQGELTNVVMGEPRVHVPNVLPTLLIDSDLIIRTFLPYFTYPVISYCLFSSGNEDTIFDPGISTFHFSSLKPVAYENPIVIFLFFCFCPKDKGIRGEIPQDHEDPCLFSILQSSGLRSFAYFGILNPDHPSNRSRHLPRQNMFADLAWLTTDVGSLLKDTRYKGLKTKQKRYEVAGNVRWQYKVAAAGQSEHDTCLKRVIRGCQACVSPRYQRTMAELLRAPTKGYAEAIVVPPILAEHFELKHSLINMMTSDQFFGLEKDNPHDHIRWFNKITSTIKYKDVPNSAIKLMLFPFSLAGAARRWLEKEPPRSILTWEDLVSKFINEFFPPSRTTNLRNEISNFQQRFDESFHEAWDRYKDLLRACPHHGFTELHQLDTFYNALNPADQDSLNSAAGGNLLERTKLTHAVNQQTSVVTTAMTAILKQFQATPPPASVKAVEEICVTCGGAHPYYQCLAADGNTFPEYRDNIQGYVAAAAGNYNQGNSGYRPPGVANQTRPSGFVQQNGQNNQNRFSQPQGYNRGNNFNQNANYQAPIQQNQSVPLSELEKIKKMNDVNIKAMQAQINNVKNELRNEMQSSIQASMSNQIAFFQMNTTSTSSSGSLPSNNVANPKGELKAITTRSGLVLDVPTVLMPPPFINPEEDERVEETLIEPEHGEYTIKVPPPLIQKAKPPSQRNFVVYQRDPRHPHIPYPSRMNQ
ncbi:reverse transcriptase domain-containing protein [Tanacetum coccineum]